MRTAIILLVLCALACFGSAATFKKSRSSSRRHSKYARKDKIISTSNFMDTCQNIKFSGTYISALCPNSFGGYIFNEFNIDLCLGNDDGNFSCGSFYSATAQSPKISGSILSAKLRTADRRNWVQSSVNLNEFISNWGGSLICNCVG